MKGLFNTNKKKAKKLLDQVINMDETKKADQAVDLYAKIIKLDPEWSTPHYNLGLIYKYRGEWQKSYDCNQQAVKLDLESEAAWWNLGIAATFLQDWRTARQAWNKFNLGFDVNDDPLELDMGNIPVRLNPDTNGEVVWCKRIDPARAVIYNIPLPDSDHRFGDLVLNDGAAVGYRINNGVEYPVFNELQLLTKSAYKTYSITAEIEDQLHIDKLETLCEEEKIEMEDWSTIKFLCKKCSEGVAHDHHDNELKDDNRERRIGFAALNEEILNQVLANWRVITLCEHSDIILELE